MHFSFGRFFLQIDFLILSVCQGWEGAEDSRLVVESNFNFHDCQEIMCWRQCTLFKNSNFIKMHTLDILAADLCVCKYSKISNPILTFGKSWKSFCKRKRSNFLWHWFFWKITEWHCKIGSKTSIHLVTLLLVFPSSNVWNLYLYL